MTGRLVVRRIPDATPRRTEPQVKTPSSIPGASTPSSPPPTPRCWTRSPPTRPIVATPSSSRSKHSALAHLPSGKFNANAAWLVLTIIALNLTPAAGTLTTPDLARATTATIRRTLVCVPARMASSARRITLHLPQAWSATHRPSSRPDHPAAPLRHPKTTVEHPGQRGPANLHALRLSSQADHDHATILKLIGGSRLRPRQTLQNDLPFSPPPDRSPSVAALWDQNVRCTHFNRHELAQRAHVQRRHTLALLSDRDDNTAAQSSYGLQSKNPISGRESPHSSNTGREAYHAVDGNAVEADSQQCTGTLQPAEGSFPRELFTLILDAVCSRRRSRSRRTVAATPPPNVRRGRCDESTKDIK